MTTGISSAAFYGQQESEDNVSRIRRCFLTQGCISTCEIFLETPSEYESDFAHLLAERLTGSETAQDGTPLPPLDVTAVHPKGTQFEQDLFGRSRRQVEDSFSLFTKVCETGEAVGAKYYVFHGPFGVHTPLKPEKIYKLEETAAKMQEIALLHHIEVLWEDVHWCALRTPRDVQWVREHIPNQHFVLDVKQVILAYMDEEKERGRSFSQNPLTDDERMGALITMMDVMGSSLSHVHILDADEKGKFCLPGEGCVDWRSFFGKLQKMGYGGAVILEPYSQQAEDNGRVMESLKYIEKSMGVMG